MGVVVHTCNLSNPEPEAGQIDGQPGLHIKALPLKTKQRKQQQQNQREQFRIKGDWDTSEIKATFLVCVPTNGPGLLSEPSFLSSCTFNL